MFEVCNAQSISAVKPSQNRYQQFITPQLQSISQTNTQKFLIRYKHKKITILTDMDIPKYLMPGYYSVRGTFLVNVQSYKTFGWKNEYFTGWKY